MKPLEIVAVVLLGGGLLAAGWRDWQTARRDRPDAGPLDFLRTENVGIPRVGHAEFLFREEGLAELDGVGGIERSEGGRRFRHGLGPATRLVLRSETAREAVFSFRFANGVEQQNLVARYDDQPLETFSDLPADAKVERTFRLPLGPGGEHVFRLEYDRWNHHGADLNAADDRPVAGGFSRLELLFQ